MSVTIRPLTFALIIQVAFVLLANAQAVVTPLEINKPIDLEVKRGDPKSVSVKLQSGQLMEVVAESAGFDVELDLYSKTGEKLLKVDTFFDDHPERLFYISKHSDEYKVEVSTSEKSSRRCVVRLDSVRNSNVVDQKRMNAILLESEADTLIERPVDETIARNAVGKYMVAADIYHEINDPDHEVATLTKVGPFNRLVGFYPDVAKALERAVKTAEPLSDKRLIANALIYLGETYAAAAYEIQGDFSKAIYCYDRILSISRSMGYLELTYSAYEMKGDVFRAQGQFTEARHNYLQALDVAETIPNFWKKPISLQEIAVTYSRQGNYPKAVEYNQLALQSYGSLGDKSGVGEITLNLGSVYGRAGLYENAIIYFKRANEIFEELRDKRSGPGNGQGLAILNSGEMYGEIGDFQEAVKLAQEALPIFERNKSARFIAGSLNLMGVNYLRQKNYEQAAINLSKALTIRESLSDTSDVSETLNSLAEVSLEQQDLIRAKELSERSAAYAKDNGDLEKEWKARLNLGKAYFGLKQFNSAETSTLESIARIDELQKQSLGGAYEAQAQFSNKVEPFKFIQRLYIESGENHKALFMSERMRSNVILSALRSEGSKFESVVSFEELSRYNSIKRELSALNQSLTGKLTNKQIDEVTINNIRALLKQKQLEFDDFQTKLVSVHPQLRMLQSPIDPIGVSEMGELVSDPHRAIIEFTVTEAETIVYVVAKNNSGTNASLSVYRVPIPKGGLSKQIDDFRTSLANGDLAFSKPAKDLYRILLGPLESQLKRKSSLIIVPDGELWNLPFQSLIDPAGRYLAEKSAISYAPSVTALREMTKKAKTRKPDAGMELVAFGNPIVGTQTKERVQRVFMSEKLEPLPESERLVNELAKMYGPNRSKVYIGSAAREETAKAEVPKYRIVQFATHGILNNVSPMYSHLVLAQNDKNPSEDGLLEAWEMKDLDLKADMVILSACDTARGRISNGEGVIGMTWAAFIAGAPTTVASQWKVESKSTTDLMLEFHRQLLTGKFSKAEALRRAELKLMKMPQYKHPSYWAGFVIVGDGS